MLLVIMIQIVVLSACGKEANVTPMGTDIAQTERSESTEDITVSGGTEQDREEGGI